MPQADTGSPAPPPRMTFEPTATPGDSRIVPGPPPDGDGVASPDAWGFGDTAFRIAAGGDVTVSGTRYDGLSGERLPHLLPWFQRVIQAPLRPSARQAPPSPPPPGPERSNPGFLQDLAGRFGAAQIDRSANGRRQHGHGQTQAEMYTLRFGQLPRIPDCVVSPGDDEEVAALVAMAVRHGVSLIPYGGGTNVSGALRCPEKDERMIVSVDMRRMNRILWIDPINRLACIQAGAVGRHLRDQLAEHGWTMGHEPDSIEFSTLGGWIATHASGMKKNRYGNIEDIVQDVTLVSPSGLLSHTGAAPRESIGIDPRRWVFGSEGALGIITSAIVRLCPLPEVQRYGSVLLPDFSAGVRFMYALTQSGMIPANVRLVDNLQFQFGQALKPAGADGWKSRLEKWYVTRVRGYDRQEMAACTIVFEGTRAEVAAQEAAVYRIAASCGGMKAGAASGRRGYRLTYGIAYIRDFVMTHDVLAESFETSVCWSDALALCTRVKQRIRDEHAALRLPGLPFVSCRITQVYPTGVCVYFYVAFAYAGVADPLAAYHAIETAARDEVLRCGGSLSHHHGIGKVKQPFLPRVLSPAALAWRVAAKRALDPTDVFGCGNLAAAGDP